MTPHEKWLKTRLDKRNLRISIATIRAKLTLRFIENEVLGMCEFKRFNWFENIDYQVLIK